MRLHQADSQALGSVAAGRAPLFFNSTCGQFAPSLSPFPFCLFSSVFRWLNFNNLRPGLHGLRNGCADSLGSLAGRRWCHMLVTNHR